MESSWTWDQTHVPCTNRQISYPLCHQRIPKTSFFFFFFFKAACLVPLISVASPYSTNSASCIHITISQGSRKYRNKHVRKVEKSSQAAPPSKQSSKKVRERSAAGWGNDHFQTELNCQKKREGFKGAASDNHTERSSKSLITTQRQVKTTRYQGTTIRMAKIKTFKATRMQKRWTIRPCWWECRWNRHSRKQFAVLHKTRHAAATQSSHCTPGSLS